MNVLEKAQTDAFVKPFLKDDNDKVKSKWPEISEYAKIAKNTGSIEEVVYKNIKQKYGIHTY